jgi:adenine-specific DNA-methyltransferase
MANLSQQKRERMLAFLDTLKKKNADDDDTLRAIGEIENELNSKKYGLVWEQHEEAVDIKMKDYIPVFTEDHDREITAAPGEDYNFLLEGDNLHSLKLLEKTHKGRIDVIYIDPPYNTGNKDFMYDDAYLDTEDGFRHSKWLSFMYNRLSIARNLLSDTGTIFISIDDNEQASLKMLCDEIFGDKNFFATLPRVTKKSGKDHTGAVAKNNDYVLMYAKNHDMAQFKGVFASNEDYPLKDEYYNLRGGYKLNQTLDYDSLWYNPAMDFPIEVEGKMYFPGGDEKKYKSRHNGNHKAKDWVWRWSLEKFKFGLDNGFVVIKQGRGRPRIYTKTYANASISKARPYTIEYQTRETKLSSIALIDNKFSNDNAKKEITKVGFDEFGFPKPSSLIAQLIQICQNQKLVLDFFAGSGTTAQAVLELNQEDGGNRHFILCTNNENGICENVTYPRVKTVITGIRTDGSKYSDGIPANLKYYKTDFVARNEEYLSDALLQHIAEMIQLENGIKLDGRRYLMILTDEQADDISSHWDQYPDVKAIYLSKNVLLTTDQETLFEKIPVYIIPDYYFDFELREEGESW